MSKKYLIIILSVGIILILVLSVLLFGGNKTVAITFDSTGGSTVESFGRPYVFGVAHGSEG